MPTLLDVYQHICTVDPPLIAVSRQKDILTSLKYLVASYDSSLETMVLTPTIEAEYREHLRTYLIEQHKGPSTIRNSLQCLAQLWKAVHVIDQTPPVPPQALEIPSYEAASTHMFATSPYLSYAWLKKHPYRLSPSAWPSDIAERWDAYRLSRKYELRTVSLDAREKDFALYLSYHLIAPDNRFALLHDLAQTMLKKPEYADDLKEIMRHPILTSWDELFDLGRVNSFVTWTSWRSHLWENPDVREQKPHRPSTQGYRVAIGIEQLAKRTQRPEAAALNTLLRSLPLPKSIHDKLAPMHRFDLFELEEVALQLIEESRRMIHTNPRSIHRGAFKAGKFQAGLILQLAWRNPMRARNWCDAILGTHLKREHGQWRWRFEGDDLKIGKRNHGTEPNIFAPDVPVDVAPHLEEFLSVHRPKLPHASENRHVFLNTHGLPFTQASLLLTLKINVYRYTGKRLYTHLLRSLFISHHLTAGVDINSVAYGLNDQPATVLDAYNKLFEDKHRPILQDANRRALETITGPRTLTPPPVPIRQKAPVAPKPMKADPSQMDMDLS